VEVLSDRALNRATLARQFLLEPASVSPLSAIEHLVGLQAQVPNNPHLALWARLAGFETSQLDDLLERRQVVRSAAIRGTIHLLSGRDCLDLWPLSRPVLDRELNTHRDFAPRLREADLSAPMNWAREYLAEPRTQPELKAALGERFPDFDPAALAFACRNILALVQVPPRGMWGRAHQVTVATAEAWIGAPLNESISASDLVVRYLAAFGPARPADMATWSRLTGLAKAFADVEAELVTFVDERGRALFDLPDAPRPDPSTPAPVRFLPEYDNVLLSHDDRSRFAPSDVDVSALYPPGRLGRGHVLVDGRLRGSWVATDDRLDVLHPDLSKKDWAEVLQTASDLSSLFGLAAEPRLELVGSS
jgi:hypothetical protein